MGWGQTIKDGVEGVAYDCMATGLSPSQAFITSKVQAHAENLRKEMCQRARQVWRARRARNEYRLRKKGNPKLNCKSSRTKKWIPFQEESFITEKKLTEGNSHMKNEFYYSKKGVLL